MSFENLLLYTAATPMYDDEREKPWDEATDMNNPRNFNKKYNTTNGQEIFIR